MRGLNEEGTMTDFPALEMVIALAMLGLGFLGWKHGAYSAAILLSNVLFAGVLTFNFYEPLAATMGDAFGSGADPYLDTIVIALLFAIFLAVFRLFTGFLTPRDPAMHTWTKQIGGAVIGLVTGWLAAGIVICACLRLPWDEGFLNHPHGVGLGGPDQLWLDFVGHSTENIFDWPDEKRFEGKGFSR